MSEGSVLNKSAEEQQIELLARLLDERVSACESKRLQARDKLIGSGKQKVRGEISIRRKRALS